ncbi:MAG TPA: hypothetical protein VGB03_07975 [Acidimicrobiales bacterium]
MAVLMLVPLLPGCGKSEAADEEVRDAIRRTARLAMRFDYSDQSGEQAVAVQGVVEDDFRYRTRLALNGSPVLDQVVNDDAIALRVLQPEFTSKLVVPGPGTVDAPAGKATVKVPVTEALSKGSWVIDRQGAPSMVATEAAFERAGADPVFDALTALRYIERAIDDVPFVRRFNPEALDYKPAEDPFPHPPEGSGIRRFDYQRPGLPRRQSAAGSGNEAVPELRHFRRLSVYIKDGLVVEVLEEIDVETRLRELARIYDADLSGSSPREQAQIAVAAINALRVGQGKPPMRIRSMSLRLAELGKPQKVELPADALQGPIELLNTRARAEAGGGDNSGGGDDSTTTTTAPPA